MDTNKIIMDANVRIAFESLRSNVLRTRLTVAVIAVGIMSLVSIQTAVEIMSEQVAGSFEKMGAGMFTISSGQGGQISLRQATVFAEEASFARTVSIYRNRDMMARVSFEGESTDPVVSVICADENYLSCQGGVIGEGRDILPSDVSDGKRVVILGDNVRRRIFPSGDGIGNHVTLPSGRYLVVGLLERRGAVFGTGLDNSAIIPLTDGDGINIDVVPDSGLSLEDAALCSSTLLRGIRRTGPASPQNFEIVKSGSVEEGMASLKNKLSIAALAIGLLTLLGASVGLMNIMLVSVRERTREIGLRKSLGARSSTIGNQFLLEAVMIGQAGGAAGILLGVLFGNLAALIMDGEFAVPWKWVFYAVALCLAVSLFSGFLPARKAAALDPVDALREE